MTGPARRLSTVPAQGRTRAPAALAGLAALALAVTPLAACRSDTDRAGGPTSGASAPTSVATGAPTTTASRSPTATSPTTRPSRSRVTAATTKPRSTPGPLPKPSPKPSPKPPSSGGVAAQVLSLVNSERARAGCGAVRTSSALQTAAQRHSADMAARDYFSHTSKDGRSFADRIRAAGYRGGTIGENIAAGQTTAAAVMRSWMASPGHRANILNCAFTSLGVGHAAGGSYRHYWTQDFGG